MHKTKKITYLYILCQYLFLPQTCCNPDDNNGAINARNTKNHKHRDDAHVKFNNDYHDNNNNALDHEETRDAQNAEEKEINNAKKDDLITDELLAKEKSKTYANKVEVSLPKSSNNLEWVDGWSGCKCGTGVPGEQIQDDKKSVKRIASGYGPNK